MLTSLLLALTLALSSQAHDVRASPFDGLRWEGDTPIVLLGDAWYRPTAIDGLTVTEILATCEARWPGKMRKRFAEDLVEAMALLGWEGDRKVDLDLVRVDDGKAVRLEGVEMTRARRNAIRDAANAAMAPPPTAPALLSADAARAELDLFGATLAERFAYVSLGGVDLAAELESCKSDLPEEVSNLELADRMHRLLMRFGDGHARVSSPYSSAQPGDAFLPFLLVESADGVVAIRPDRSALIEESRPVVAAIDGRGLDEWVEALAPRIAAGSPQLIRRRALGDMREIDEARRALGLPTGGPLTVTFTDAKGRKKRERELERGRYRPTYGTWPEGESRILDGDIGYLRIPRMDDSTDELHAAMDEFVDTKGLIVDVRGNGGGSRELLLALSGYLIGPDEDAVVGNVAQYRLAPGFGPDHLEARFMYRADWDGWSDKARAAIDALAPGFEPEWRPKEGMSEWHYLVLERTGDPREYFYDLPVVVLSDSGCFSATDIFLGALELLPRVTLVGTASSGGSARSQSFLLPTTQIEVRCASMASFRPDGRLYDTRGIEVDVEVLPASEDFLAGGGDAQLEAARKLLRRPR